MGTRVRAQFEIYPYNREELEQTAPGLELLAAVDSVIGDHEVSEDLEQEGSRLVELYTVNYGTSTFNEAGLPHLATAAGVIYQHIDEGSPTWQPTREVFLPTGRTFEFLEVEGGVLSKAQYARMCRNGKGDQIGAYFDLIGLSLPEMAAELESGALVKRLDSIGLWPPPKPAEPPSAQPAPSDELIFDMPDPPAIRGPGSNQYQDKPPLPAATRRR